MIIGTITLLLILFGGEDGFFPENFNKQVKKQLSDAQQVEQVKEITKQIEEDTKAYNKFVEKTAEEILELDANYDVTGADYHQLTAIILTERRKTQAQFIEGRLQIRELITREEWSTIFNENNQ